VQLGLRLGICVVVILGAAALASAGRDPFVTEPWLALDPALLVAASATAGLGIAALVVVATRWALGRFAWGGEWAADLAADLRGASDARLFLAALTAGLAEELFFRGLLSQAIGIWASAIVFGVVHQLRLRRGSARWAWMASATAMGLALGTLFHATGSLLGPIVAHVVVNFANTRYLRDAPARPRRRLGGLLRRGAA
jgi:membrane protease YdiL (CAAX protease family)